MTVAPVSPALAALAAIRTEVATAVTTVAGAGAAASSQSGGQPLAVAVETAAAAASLTLPTMIDALALKAAAQAALGEGGLALLMADLSQALQISGLPTPVQTAIGQILALRTPLDATLTGADIKAALIQANPSIASQSGLTAALLAATSPALSTGPLTSALQDLQQALKTWVAGAVPQPQSPAQLPASPNGVTTSPEVTTRQAGAALVTDLAQALRASGLPEPVQSALLQLLAPAPSIPTVVPNAPNSGLMSVPAHAAPSAGPASPGTTAAVPSESVAPLANLTLAVPALEQAVNALIAATAPEALAPTQAGVAPPTTATQAGDSLLAVSTDIKAALPSNSPTAPLAAGVGPAAGEVPASTVAPTTTAAGASALPETVLSALAASVDAKEVMQIFQQVFKAWFDSGSAQPSSAAAVAGAALESPAVATLPSNPPNATNAPPPPYRGGPTTAQPAVPSTLPLSADSATVGNRLMRETSAALAHQELLQIASLPASTQGAIHGDARNPQWMFEIPFATAQGTAIAQFKISRDGGKGSTKGGKEAVWRARFSLDVEPMGPVHAQIVLSGDRTWVSLWAEREDSVTRLREHEALLTTSLKDSNFVAEVAFHAGAPRQPATAGRHFLDHAS